MKKKVLLTLLALVTICVIYFGFQFKELFDVLREVDIEEIVSSSENEESTSLIDEPIVSDANNNPQKVDNMNGVDYSNNDTNETHTTKITNASNAITKPVSNSNTSVDTNEKLQEQEQEQDQKNQKQPEKSNTVVSAEKISNVENSISMADKAKAVKLILSKLSSSDIKTLKGLASGGLTAEEKKKAVKIAYSKYSEEEIKIIKELYSKYVKN